ncbi:MAG: hypothetical protein KAG14_01875 [Mycoplasmataceae bacterium]|nr:hypothetical protein [Mycoplasmataceae bacterium]
MKDITYRGKPRKQEIHLKNLQWEILRNPEKKMILSMVLLALRAYGSKAFFEHNQEIYETYGTKRWV